MTLSFTRIFPLFHFPCIIISRRVSLQFLNQSAPPPQTTRFSFFLSGLRKKERQTSSGDERAFRYFLAHFPTLV